MFRFNYSQEFIEANLETPHSESAFKLAVKYKGNICAFILGTPITLQFMGTKMNMIYIDYLTIHQKLRQKRLAPVLIREITRRSVIHKNIKQALYLTSTLITPPISSYAFGLYPLNISKLIENDFWSSTISLKRLIKLYQLPKKPKYNWHLPNAQQLVSVINDYQTQFKLSRLFDIDECYHFIKYYNCRAYRNNAIIWYLVDNKCLKTNQIIKEIIIHSLYNNDLEISELISELLALLASQPADVIIINQEGQITEAVLKDAKFKIAHNNQYVYLYNCQINKLASSEINLAVP